MKYNDANGLIVNVVIRPASASIGVDESSRSPSGLLSLLRALQADEMSQVYDNDFFQTIERDYRPPEVVVRLCDADGQYRVICQYTDLGMESQGSIDGSVIVFIITVFMFQLLLVVICQYTDLGMESQ